MYILAQFIDNSAIFTYKGQNFTPHHDLMRNTGNQTYSILLKKNEKYPAKDLWKGLCNPVSAFSLVYKKKAFVVFLLLLIHTNKIVTVRALIIAPS